MSAKEWNITVICWICDEPNLPIYTKLGLDGPFRSPVTNPTAHPQFIKLFSRTRNGTEIVFGMKYLLKWRFNLVQMKAPGSVRSKPWRSKV